MLTTVLTGIYLTATAWGAVPWVIVAIASVVLLIAMVMTRTRPRVAALGRALAAEKGTLSRNFQALANHPLLEVSLKTRIVITLGTVFLMTVKPGLGGSLLSIAIAIVTGLSSALHMPAHRHAKKEMTE